MCSHIPACTKSELSILWQRTRELTDFLSKLKHMPDSSQQNTSTTTCHAPARTIGKTRSEQDCHIGQTFLNNIVQGGSTFWAGIESRVGARERERERGRKRGGRGTEGERRREERRGRRGESRHKQGVLHHGTARSGKRREPPIQGSRQQSPSRSQVPK